MFQEGPQNAAKILAKNATLTQERAPNKKRASNYKIQEIELHKPGKKDIRIQKSCQKSIKITRKRTCP